MGLFKAPLPKNCHIYPAMRKLGTAIPSPKRIQKIYKSHDTPLNSAVKSALFTGNQQFLFYQEILI